MKKSIEEIVKDYCSPYDIITKPSTYKHAYEVPKDNYTYSSGSYAKERAEKLAFEHVNGLEKVYDYLKEARNDMDFRYTSYKYFFDKENARLVSISFAVFRCLI